MLVMRLQDIVSGRSSLAQAPRDVLSEESRA